MSQAGFDVIVCGSLHLDIMVKGAHIPRLDETAVGAEWGMECGGKGGNQAVMAARMGARTAMIGRVGEDDFGRRLLANLDRFNVERTGVSKDQKTGSGMSVAILDAQGDYGAVIVSGSNLKLQPEAVSRSWNGLGGAKALVLQNEIPEAVNVSAALAAKASGALVILNAAPARPMSEDLLRHVDVLVVNRVEAEMMSGAEVKDAASAVAALPALGAGARDIIVTLGGQGLVLHSRQCSPVFIAPHPVKAASTHGAGDCFMGALAARLADGETLPGACETANRAAAAYVSLSEDRRGSFDFLAMADDAVTHPAG